MPIQNRIAQYFDDMKSWRHHFHKFPELAYNEFNTSKKVVKLLKEFKVDDIETGIGGTGVVAVIKNGAGKSIGLRADMDALPIPEENNKPLLLTKQRLNACLRSRRTYNHVIRCCKIFVRD